MSWVLVMWFWGNSGQRSFIAVPGFENKMWCELSGRNMVADFRRTPYENDQRIGFMCSQVVTK